MKKLLNAVLLGIAVLAAPAAQADNYFDGYLWYSDICRTGKYYTVLPYYLPVGNYCYNSYWGLHGSVTMR